MAKKTQSEKPRTTGVKYKRAVNSIKDKYTTISLVPYINTTGVIMRKAGNSTFVDFCEENPLEVLKIAFPDYHVTRFNGYELFSSGDFEKTTPMLGLSISGFGPVSGIKGGIEELLKLDEILKVKRDKPISNEDIQRIITHLKLFKF
ncbi:MAG: hypothetical protein KJ559_01365 [Nanoarchaeota archaeon]|nr:hypothetical protein [Nanoarchaeota archaeon]